MLLFIIIAINSNKGKNRFQNNSKFHFVAELILT